jgi:hypothetical protein
MTDEWQPLDRRIFGNLKGRCRSRFDALFQNPNASPSIFDSLAIMVNVWKGMEEDEVMDAWSHITGM